jgi:hypothetical protein
MSDFARSDARNSRSAGSVRLPVLGAAGGNVGVAVQANRSAQSVSAHRDDGARRSPLVKALSLQSDNPEPPPIAAKLPCDEDNVRNGQATLRPRPGKVKIGGEHAYCVQIASDGDRSNSADRSPFAAGCDALTKPAQSEILCLVRFSLLPLAQ